MLKIGQRWKRVNIGNRLLVVEVVSLRGDNSIRGKIVQKENYPSYVSLGEVSEYNLFPINNDLNEYWMLLEGQEAPA